MTPVEISEHLYRVYAFVRRSGCVTSMEIAEGARVAPRTARHHARTLVDAGLFDRVEVFPGPRYRIADAAERRDQTLLRRIESAGTTFGSAR